MKYCYRCGQALWDGFGYCPYCGTAMPPISAPVHAAQPERAVPAGARVMSGLSKGLGVAALVFSIFSSLRLITAITDFSDGYPVEASPLFALLFLTSLFSVPALLLGIFAQKQGASPTKGKVFGMIGCTVCALLLLLGLLNL